MVDVRILQSSNATWPHTKNQPPPPGSPTAKVKKMHSKESAVQYPVVAENDLLHSSLGLPSIMQADVELIADFMNNVLQYLSIEYDDLNGTCVLKFQ